MLVSVIFNSITMSLVGKCCKILNEASTINKIDLLKLEKLKTNVLSFSYQYLKSNKSQSEEH